MKKFLDMFKALMAVAMMLGFIGCADEEPVDEDILCNHDGVDLRASEGYTEDDCYPTSEMPDEDTGSDPGTTLLYDVDNDGVEDGRFDPVIYFEDTVCVHTSIVGWSGAAYVVGYGFTGAYDWATLIHELDWEDSADGTEADAWGCYSFADYGWVYRVNITRLGSSGPADFTNWADLTREAFGDELVWFNPDSTLALCFTAIDGVIEPGRGSTCDITYDEMVSGNGGGAWLIDLMRLEETRALYDFGL